MSDPTYIRTVSGPLTLDFICHESEASFDAEAGRLGAMLEDAHRWHVHRFTITGFYREFIPWVESFSGQPKAPTETPVAYLNRIWPELTESQQSQIRDTALASSQKIKVDVSPRVKVAATPLAYFRRADSILAQPEPTIRPKLQKFLQALPQTPLLWDTPTRPNRDSLASFLQAFDALQLSNLD